MEEGSYLEEEDDLSFLSEDVQSISSKVSKLTFGDETAVTGTSFKTHHTGFKSILYQQDKLDRDEARSKKKKRTVYGATALLLPFIIDTWSSTKKAQMCCSVQVMCLGTRYPKRYHMFRVSTDRLFLVLNIVISENALDEKKAFYKTIDQLPPMQRDMIEYHTKFAARKMSVGKLTSQEQNKVLEIEQRIPLPFE